MKRHPRFHRLHATAGCVSGPAPLRSLAPRGPREPGSRLPTSAERGAGVCRGAPHPSPRHVHHVEQTALPFQSVTPTRVRALVIPRPVRSRDAPPPPRPHRASRHGDEGPLDASLSPRCWGGTLSAAVLRTSPAKRNTCAERVIVLLSRHRPDGVVHIVTAVVPARWKLVCSIHWVGSWRPDQRCRARELCCSQDADPVEAGASRRQARSLRRIRGMAYDRPAAAGSTLPAASAGHGAHRPSRKR